MTIVFVKNLDNYSIMDINSTSFINFALIIIKTAMKKALLFILTVTVVFAQSQVAPDKYFVRFTDKDDSPYSLSNPSEFLSQRAIDRRSNQGISLDVTDLPVNTEYLIGVAATGAGILNTSKWLNGVSVYADDPSIIDAINALPYVAGTVRITAGQNTDAQTHEKEFFKYEQYGMPAPANVTLPSRDILFEYGQSFNQISMIQGDHVHEMGYRGQGMVIAVLDAGFIGADTHPAFDSLWNNNQILGTRDFVDGGEVSFTAHPHGTMVLGTMGANYPGELIGTAPLASYWLIRSEDGGTEFLIEEYNWVSAAEFADSAGADIINSSLGYTEFDDPSMNHTYADMDGNSTPITIGADFAASKGILVVNSAGNSGTSSWYFLSAPSDGDSVMGIGAVDGSGNYVSFSGKGPSADGRTKPNVVAQGSGVYTVDPWNMFTYSGGTSFSSPIMAGISACLWQANPDMNNMEILSAIEQSASQYTTPDDFLGYGIPDIMLANNILTVIEGPERKAEKILVYPNPFTDNFSIELLDNSSALQEGRAEVVDLTGKIVVSTEITLGSRNIVEAKDLLPGMYFLKVTANGRHVSTMKLLKK